MTKEKSTAKTGKDYKALITPIVDAIEKLGISYILLTKSDNIGTLHCTGGKEDYKFMLHTAYEYIILGNKDSTKAKKEPKAEKKTTKKPAPKKPAKKK